MSEDAPTSADTPPLPVSSIPAVESQLAQITDFMRLMREVLEYARPPERAMFPNTVAAVSCFIRALNGLQASVLLCLSGFYTESQAAVRGVYESAGLGRMLAHDSPMAERWLHQGTWVPDRSSRAFIGSLIAEGGEDVYREYYRNASALAHPTALSTLPYVFNSDGEYHPVWEPVLDITRCQAIMREIVVEAAFVCFAIRMAAVDEEAMDPTWLRNLSDLAREVTGQEMPHLDRDWTARQIQFDLFRSKIRHDSELDEALESDPNSYRNIVRRLDYDQRSD